MENSITTPGNLKSTPKPVGGFTLNGIHYIFICTLAVTIMMIIALSITWMRRYRSLSRKIRTLESERRSTPAAHLEAPGQSSHVLERLSVTMGTDARHASAPRRQCTKSGAGSLWRPPRHGPHLNRADLSLLQLLKAGQEATLYKAKMTHGTCKGHSTFICKTFKEGVTPTRVKREVAILRKMGTHKNLMQLLDWDLSRSPYLLVLDSVAHGTLRSYLQVNQETLSMDPDLQHHLTIAAYHIAHAMDHLRSKMVVHCDLALRNIMVNRFPGEVKVAEFGLARDLTQMRSRRSSRKKDYKLRVPLRWYPPEYFRNSYYGFKGDVWAYGIVIWEMQTFGLLPYPDLGTSEEVVKQVCSGQRNSAPDGCRPEILQIMRDCWQDPCSLRPTFTDIVQVLENVLENDMDYVDLNNT